MRAPNPDAQLRAGHLPADLYRQLPPGTDPRSLVIVQAAPRSYLGPVVLVLAVTVGAVVLVAVGTAAVMQLASVAATTAAAIQAAVPTLVGGGGIGLALRLGKTSSRKAPPMK